MRSVTHKLALVAAGLADATWTFTPKHEWDVAAGVALVEASGGSVWTLEGRPLTFNCSVPRLDGLVAFSAGAHAEFSRLFEEWLCHRYSLRAGKASPAVLDQS